MAEDWEAGTSPGETPATGTVQAPPPPAPPAGAVGGSAPGHSPRAGGAVWFGVVLLVIGALIIGVRVMPDLRFWGFWPAAFIGLLFIIFGIRGMFGRVGADDGRLNLVVEGLTGITIGVILISNSTGALGWSVWWSVLSLWPLLLIAGGIDLIGKGTHSVWLRVLSSAIVLVGLWYGAFVLSPGSTPWAWSVGGTSTEPFEFSEPARSAVRTGDATVEGAVGSLTIEGGGDLATARGRTPYGEPRFDVETAGSRATVDVRVADSDTVVFGLGDSELDVTLDSDVLWDLEIRSGVSQLDADLSDIRISDLLVKSGVSEAEVTLGDAPEGEVEATFESGISNLTIRVPEDVAVRVEAQSGLSDTDVPDSYSHTSDGWESDGFEDADDRYVLLLKSGISSFTIETY